MTSCCSNKTLEPNVGSQVSLWMFLLPSHKLGILSSWCVVTAADVCGLLRPQGEAALALAWTFVMTWCFDKTPRSGCKFRTKFWVDAWGNFAQLPRSFFFTSVFLPSHWIAFLLVATPFFLWHNVLTKLWIQIVSSKLCKLLQRRVGNIFKLLAGWEFPEARRFEITVLYFRYVVFSPWFGAWLVALSQGRMFDFIKTVKLSMVALKQMATLKLPNRGLAEVAIMMIMIMIAEK